MYFKVRQVLSYLPYKVLRFMYNRWHYYDPADGWNIWIDADYEKYCRKDKKRNPELYKSEGSHSYYGGSNYGDF